MEQAGRTVVGNSSTQIKQVAVAFPQAFPTVPVVVANTLQTDPNYPPGSIKDTFAVSITGVTTTAFRANICRVDATAGGWGQNLSLGWAATTP